MSGKERRASTLPSLDDEQPAIAFLLEHLDSDMTTLVEDALLAATAATQRGYFLLAATLHEFVVAITIQRMQMIAWGLALGLTGINTEEVIEDISTKTILRVPDIYHQRIRSEATKVLEQIHEHRENPA